jgi:hypothetical protein
MTMVPISIVRVTNLRSIQVDPNRTLDLHYRKGSACPDSANGG